MITHIASAVLLTVIAAGILLQVAALTCVGGHIARVRVARRIAKWRKRQSKLTPSAVRPATALKSLPRRRCRDYRTALRTVKA
jgi:hypothetical protein